MTLVTEKLYSYQNNPISQYNLSGVHVTSDNKIVGELINTTPLKNNASKISLFLTFYQDGIMQVNMKVDGE